VWPGSGFFVLTKALPESMVFPFNFGFVPNRLSDDGNALDVLVLNDEPLVCGCLLKVKPVAVVKATQTVFGEREPTARKILVGEQPGSDEDLAGKPFVGGPRENCWTRPSRKPASDAAMRTSPMW
jgi:hypothetical protein